MTARAAIAFLALAGLAPAARSQCVHDKLVPFDETLDAEFGAALATDGDVLVVGAPGSASVFGGMQPGSADIFRRVGNAWNHEVRLLAPDGAHHDDFGTSVAVSGDTVLIGAPNKQDAGAATGAAYVFRHDGAAWNLEAELLATPLEGLSLFGLGVALDGDMAVVSTPVKLCGYVHVFKRSGTTWSHVQKFTWSGLTGQALFGNSLDLDGDDLFIGAPRHAQPFLGSGLVFIYHWNGTAFVQQAMLQASDVAQGDEFGWALSHDGDVLAVGAPQRDQAGAQDAGAVYLFRKSAGVWTEEAMLDDDSPEYLGRFGRSVALQGTVLAVGEPRDVIVPDSKWTGAAWRFDDVGGAWLPHPKFVAIDSTALDELGTSVAVRGDELISGAQFDGNLDSPPWRPGAVYTWTGTSSWTSVDGFLVGSQGIPMLTGAGSLLPGTLVNLFLQHAIKNGSAMLVIGLAELDLPFKNGVLVPSPDLLLPVLTSPDGDVCLEAPLDIALPPGLALHFQCWVTDPPMLHHLSASNALRVVAP